MARHDPQMLSPSALRAQHLAYALSEGMVGSDADEFADAATAAEVETFLAQVGCQRDEQPARGDR